MSNATADSASDIFAAYHAAKRRHGPFQNIIADHVPRTIDAIAATRIHGLPNPRAPRFSIGQHERC